MTIEQHRFNIESSLTVMRPIIFGLKDQAESLGWFSNRKAAEALALDAEQLFVELYRSWTATKDKDDAHIDLWAMILGEMLDDIADRISEIDKMFAKHLGSNLAVRALRAHASSRKIDHYSAVVQESTKDVRKQARIFSAVVSVLVQRRTVRQQHRHTL